MSRYNPNPSAPQTAYFQRSNFVDLQAEASAFMATLAGRLISAITLAGGGSGSLFILAIEHTPAADGVGISPAQASSSFRVYAAGNAAAAAGAYAAALSDSVAANPGVPLRDAELVGSSSSAVFFGFLVLATQQGGGSGPVTGLPNAVAYFDAGGSLTGDALFTYIPASGFLLLGSAVPLQSNAGVQVSSTVNNRAQFRSNQYGANAATPGITGFKSRGPVATNTGILAGDPVFTITAIGVAPDNASIPLAATLIFQVPPAFVPAAQNYVPTECLVGLVPLAGPINGKRTSFQITSEGETRTLRGVRAGGPSTLPASLDTGSLWSSDFGPPNGAITGSPGDLYTDKNGGVGVTLWVKESGIATDTGWVAK